ncbi:BamA/TamA family outer membrane protein [Thermodesulfobacteriota bacterium]
MSCTSVAFGAEPTSETTHETEEREGQAANKAKKQQRWAAFPVIASSPETGLMLGGMLFHFFPTERPGEQASTVDIMTFGTSEGQYMLSVAPNIYLKDGLYRLHTAFFANYWQANYYNIGNDSRDVSEEYSSTNFGAVLTLERRLYDSFIVNIVGVSEKTDMEIKARGMLDRGDIAGADDGKYIGGGLTFGYDTRDNTNAPSKGAQARYTYMTYDKNLGSSLEFSIHYLDLRYYKQAPIVAGSVVALAVQARSSEGDVPFRQMPSPDGTFLLRGIENGRYKDNQLLSFQSEYRFPIKARFSGTVFAEFAQVAPNFSDMAARDTKSSVGCGIRYALNPSQRFNIRGDIAWVDDGIGMIINVREAF